MIKRLFIFMMLALMAMIFVHLAANYSENTSLSKLGQYYVEKGPQELGAPNLVTAVVVTYRGLDTLGEVTVLFISAAGVGLLLRRTRRKQGDEDVTSHFRKGRPGDWINHFTDDHKALFKELYPEILIGLGYESSNYW